ncbi:hypothetical protein D3C81_2177730 [compost metagenome]
MYKYASRLVCSGKKLYPFRIRAVSSVNEAMTIRRKGKNANTVSKIITIAEKITNVRSPLVCIISISS